jgi:spore coat-associated protein N
MNKASIPPWTLKFADRSAKTLMIGAALIGGSALVGSGVFASLNATAFNPATQSVTTQTLKLTQASSSVTGLTGGITTAITNMAPGDVVNRFVDLTNTGTMDGRNLKLKLAAAGTASTLTTDGTNGLQIAVYECATAWTTVTGLCSGGAGTTVLASTSATSLVAAEKALSVASLSASSVNRLRIEITLPTGSETTINGVLPSGTIQGVSSDLTWTFSEEQRLATVSQQ